MAYVLPRQKLVLGSPIQTTKDPWKPLSTGLFALCAWLRPSSATWEMRLKPFLSQNRMTFRIWFRTV